MTTSKGVRRIGWRWVATGLLLGGLAAGCNGTNPRWRGADAGQPSMFSAGGRAGLPGGAGAVTHQNRPGLRTPAAGADRGLAREVSGTGLGADPARPAGTGSFSEPAADFTSGRGTPSASDPAMSPPPAPAGGKELPIASSLSDGEAPGAGPAMAPPPGGGSELPPASAGEVHFPALEPPPPPGDVPSASKYSPSGLTPAGNEAAAGAAAPE
ncbi:MAG TPA: hypothetical protein VIL46_03865, partial [Gemmataceae bacterium]